MFTNCKSRLHQNINVDFIIASFNKVVLRIMANKINFISNNVKGFQSTNKRLKLKDKFVSNGFLILLRNSFNCYDEIKWKDDFKGEVFCSHGKPNLCGVLIYFIGCKNILLGTTYQTIMVVY